jgi:hypothetical protein
MNHGSFPKRERYRLALDFGAEQIRRLVTNHPNYFPLFTQSGKWKHESEAWTKVRRISGRTFVDLCRPDRRQMVA